MKKFFLIILPILLFFIALPLGRYPIHLDELFILLSSKVFSYDHHLPETMSTVIFQVRLPRIIAAMLIGAALSVSGAAFQGIFRNPLVSPDILGASAGAGFGAALAILFSWGITGIHLSSFFFGLAAVLLTYGLSRLVRQNETSIVLVLTGILVSTVFSSLISLIKYVADPYDKLPAITFWLMGSLTRIEMEDLFLILIPLLLGFIPLFLLRWRLNVLSFGDEEASTMGIEVNQLQVIIILSSTLLTASVVSISGMIGWVGLVIPHFARLIVGPNYKVLLPTSVLLGSSYLLLVDTLARVTLSMEIPLGILTSLIGAPFFIYLFIHSRSGWK